MIQEDALLFSDWSVERKMRALELMDNYIYKNCTPSDYISTWGKHAPTKQNSEEATLKVRKEYAEDETKFINALFAFQCCLVTDLTWLTKQL